MVRMYGPIQQEKDEKFGAFLKKAYKLGYLDITDKKTIGVLKTDNEYSPLWRKLIKLARKYGFVAHYSFSGQVTVMPHKRQLKQFTLPNYCGIQRELNKVCVREYKFKGCFGYKGYEYSLCKDCKCRKQVEK